MNKFLEALIDNAYQESVLLQGNYKKGDVFSISRDVYFLFYASDKEKGELVAGFMNDYRCGNAIYYQSGKYHCIKALINMPTE